MEGKFEAKYLFSGENFIFFTLVIVGVEGLHIFLFPPGIVGFSPPPYPPALLSTCSYGPSGCL